MLIDAHVHLDLNKYKNVTKATTQIVKEMDKANIDKAVLLSDYHTVTNDHMEQACKLFPKRFCGFGIVDPKKNKRNIKRDIDRLVSKKWCKGIKIIPRVQEVGLNQPGVFNIAEHLGLYGLPLGIDCIPIFRYAVANENYYPNAVDKLAKASPNTNIIIVHAGGHRLMDAFAVARSNHNVHLEVSYTFYHFIGSSVETDMSYSIKKLGADRFIYGSDHPSVNMRESLLAFNAFCNKHKMNPDAKKYLFCDTISKLIN